MGKRADYVSELSEYIKKNLKKGYTKESLKWALVNQGHSKMEVEKALRKVDEELANEAPILETKPEITLEVIEPKDAVVEKKSWWKRFFGF
jgi:hypothetical protein